MVDSWPSLLLRTASRPATKAIALHWGAALQQCYVTEYPKSGGTWLSRMIARYMDVPFPQQSHLPLAWRCLIHNHWEFDARLRNVFYLYRDGRDVMVSYYFHRTRGLGGDRLTPMHHKTLRSFHRLFGARFDPHDVVGNLPKYIELEMTQARGAPVSWPEHIRQWCEPRRDPVTYLSYESLLADPLAALGGALERSTGKPVKRDLLARVVERYSFARMTGRKPGEEDRGSFLRKGVAGDWMNYFNREAGEVFDSFAGEQLVRLGYEPDRRWIGRCRAG